MRDDALFVDSRKHRGDGTIHELVMAIRYDLSSAQMKLTDLIQALDKLGAAKVPRAAVNMPVTAPGCPDCGCGKGVHAGDCPQAEHARIALAEVLEAKRIRGTAEPPEPVVPPPPPGREERQ